MKMLPSPIRFYIILLQKKVQTSKKELISLNKSNLAKGKNSGLIGTVIQQAIQGQGLGEVKPESYPCSLLFLRVVLFPVVLRARKDSGHTRVTGL